MANSQALARDDQVEDVSIGATPLQGERPCQTSHRLHEQQLQTSVDDFTDGDISQRQVWWNRAMCEVMKVPEGYRNVAVLIIKWTKKLDQLNCTKEVGDLNDLFQQRFGYTTKILELSNEVKPQIQLNHAVIEFVYANNGPHNLLILYYTGHAKYNDREKYLELIGSDALDQHPSSAIWDRAERPLLEDVDGDVLAIFDTCFASNLQQKGQWEHHRTYELFAASGHGRMTAGPGPRSFTTALIASLKGLLEEYGDQSFTIRQLCEKINLLPGRIDNQSHVWSRFKRYNRYIALAPLRRTPTERMQDYDNNDNNDRTRAMLSLRLSLTTRQLTKDQIKSMAGSISKALKASRAPVKRIDWVGLQICERTTSLADVTKSISSVLKVKKRFDASRDRHSLVTTGDETVQRPAKPSAPTSDDSHSGTCSPITLVGSASCQSIPIIEEPSSTQVIPTGSSHNSGARPKRDRAENHDGEDDQPHQKFARHHHHHQADRS